jgi:hypothetical protein
MLHQQEIEGHDGSKGGGEGGVTAEAMYWEYLLPTTKWRTNLQAYYPPPLGMFTVHNDDRLPVGLRSPSWKA